MKYASTYQELLQLAVVVITLFVITQGAMQHARVEGLSMAPTLVHGDHLVVNKLAYARFSVPFFSDRANATNQEPLNFVFSAPDRGDIVIFDPPSHVPHSHALVKRIVGVPGDTVAINNHGVYINGQRHVESYLPGSFYDLTESSTMSQSNVFEVESGHYFVMGDNEWRTAEDWPPSASQLTPVFLHSSGAANSKDGDGVLNEDEFINAVMRKKD